MLCCCLICKRLLHESDYNGKPVKDGEYVICDRCSIVLGKWLAAEYVRKANAENIDRAQLEKLGEAEETEKRR